MNRAQASASPETITATQQAFLHPSKETITEAAVASYTDGYNAALDDIANLIVEYGQIANLDVIATAIRKAALAR